MKIIVDAMGGDHAPVEIVKGALAAAKARSGLELVLVGQEVQVRAAAAQCGAQQLPAGVSIVNALISVRSWCQDCRGRGHPSLWWSAPVSSL